MFLARDGLLVGLLTVSDPVKASTVEPLNTLGASGLRVIMATGDGLPTARSGAARLVIDEVHGEVKPTDKLALVEKLQGERCIVAMARTASTTRPRWHAPTSASPWAPAPTWR